MLVFVCFPFLVLRSTKWFLYFCFRWYGLDCGCEAFGLAQLLVYVLELLVALLEKVGGKCRRCAIQRFIKRSKIGFRELDCNRAQSYVFECNLECCFLCFACLSRPL